MSVNLPTLQVIEGLATLFLFPAMSATLVILAYHLVFKTAGRRL